MKKLWLVTAFVWVLNSIMQGLYFGNIAASLNALGAALTIWLLLKTKPRQENKKSWHVKYTTNNNQNRPLT